MNKKDILKIILKIFFTIISIFVCLISGLYLSIFLSVERINSIIVIWSILLLPSLLFILIYVAKKKKYLKIWGINLLLFSIAFGINYGINKYEEYITIDTNVNINCQEYLPFEEESKIVKLDYDASLKLKDNLPRVDGAAAVFPVYSAFFPAVGRFECMRCGTARTWQHNGTDVGVACRKYCKYRSQCHFYLCFEAGYGRRRDRDAFKPCGRRCVSFLDAA